MLDGAGGPRDDAILLFGTVETLLKERLYHSAEIIGGILLSRASRTNQQLEEGGGGLHAEALSMFADALKGRGEHRRATVRGREMQCDLMRVIYHDEKRSAVEHILVPRNTINSIAQTIQRSMFTFNCSMYDTWTRTTTVDV